MVNLATRLDRTRWAVKVFALGAEGQLVEALQREGIAWECLGCTRRQPIRVLLRLGQALRNFKPEIIQSFLFHANLASRLAAPWAGWPWVVSGLRVAERQKRWHLVLDRLTASLTVGWVCVSQGVLDFSREVGGLKQDRLTVIPNGIDPCSFNHAPQVSRRELGVPERAHLVLFVGRLDVQKGIDDLIAAAKQTISQSPCWHLAIVGDGPRRGWLLAQIEAYSPFRDQVHYLGRRDDVPALLQAADVLVLPSLWEGMPNVILEAMAARRAVVATAVEGTKELVVAGETGWLVPPADPQSLSAALINAVADPESRHAFGLKGRERVLSRFSIDQTVSAYDRLWSRILGFEVS